VGRLDEVVGTGFLIAATSDIAHLLSPQQIEGLHRLDAHLIRLIAPGEQDHSSSLVQDVIDIDHAYLPHLAEVGHEAAIVRPDFYLFGTATSRDEIPGLVDDLFAKLALGKPAASTSTLAMGSI
jgi:flavoprotein hydroxylase